MDDQATKPVLPDHAYVVSGGHGFLVVALVLLTAPFILVFVPLRIALLVGPIVLLAAAFKAFLLSRERMEFDAEGFDLYRGPEHLGHVPWTQVQSARPRLVRLKICTVDGKVWHVPLPMSGVSVRGLNLILESSMQPSRIEIVMQWPWKKKLVIAGCCVALGLGLLPFGRVPTSLLGEQTFGWQTWATVSIACLSGLLMFLPFVVLLISASVLLEKVLTQNSEGSEADYKRFLKSVNPYLRVLPMEPGIRYAYCAQNYFRRFARPFPFSHGKAEWAEAQFEMNESELIVYVKDRREVYPLPPSKTTHEKKREIATPFIWHEEYANGDGVFRLDRRFIVPVDPARR